MNGNVSKNHTLHSEEYDSLKSIIELLLPFLSYKRSTFITILIRAQNLKEPWALVKRVSGVHDKYGGMPNLLIDCVYLLKGYGAFMKFCHPLFMFLASIVIFDFYSFSFQKG